MRGSSVLALLLVTLVISACGELPTPYGPGPAGASPIPTPYPPPQTQPQEGSPPTPQGTVIYVDWTPQPIEDISVPIYGSICTPTPSDEERAAVEAMGLSDKIGFELQRAIYVAEQQGFPWRPAHIGIHYDPGILTVTETVALAEGYGMQVTYRYARRHHINGDAPLDIVPQLAAEPGIERIELGSFGWFDRPYCPTPGGPTPVPVPPLFP